MIFCILVFTLRSNVAISLTAPPYVADLAPNTKVLQQQRKGTGLSSAMLKLQLAKEDVDMQDSAAADLNDIFTAGEVEDWRLELMEIVNRQNKAELLSFYENVKQKVKDAKKAGLFDLAIGLATISGLTESNIKSSSNWVNEAFVQGRIADPFFKIASDGYFYPYDLDELQGYVDEVFQFHGLDHDKYLAPYFALVQSSGMGKTKLLYEFKKRLNSLQDSNTKCVFFMCTDTGLDYSRDKNRTDIADCVISVNKFPGTSAEDRDKLLLQIEHAIKESVDPNVTRVVVCFDEAQHLVRTSSDGFAFRCIRWWLRQIRSERRFVGIFTGTSASLAKYYKEIGPSDNSRLPLANYQGNSGGMLYPPFCKLNTIGIFAARSRYWMPTKNPATEWEASVLYGRPLFSAMIQDSVQNMKEAEKSILRRMQLSSGSSDKTGLPSWVSILSARIHMGHLPLKVASSIVSGGYLCLADCSQIEIGFVRSCSFPDPVCARLAMTLMLGESDEDPWCQPPRKWAEKTSEVFSNGLCLPDKGDLGEVAASLYGLFCGDICRHRIDESLRTYSIPFDSWLGELQGSGEISINNALRRSSVVSVSFIQVCRGYLRESVREIIDSGLLESWYKAGCAFYSYPNCPCYDIIAPVRYGTTDANYVYVPLLISVKNRVDFTLLDQENEFAKMKGFLNRQNISDAVSMLILFGNDKQVPKDQPTSIQSWQGVHNFTVVVDENDPYGIWNLANAGSLSRMVSTDLYCSHHDLPLLVWNDVPFQSLLTTNARSAKEGKEILEKVRGHWIKLRDDFDNITPDRMSS